MSHSAGLASGLSLKTCAESVVTLPNGTYDGLTICIDLDELSANPPELLKSTGITLRYTE